VNTALTGVGIGILASPRGPGVITVTKRADGGVMIGMAVGSDTRVHVSRHRQNPTRARARESAARAVATDGSAVGFAGRDGVIALAACSVSGSRY